MRRDHAEDLAGLVEFARHRIGTVCALLIHIAGERARSLMEETHHVARQLFRVLDLVGQSRLTLPILALVRHVSPRASCSYDAASPERNKRFPPGWRHKKFISSP